MNARGLALPTVMLLLSLVALSSLTAWRTLWMSAQALRQEADQLRNFHRAEAALPWVVYDILGPPSTEASVTDARHQASPSQPFFPDSPQALSTLQQQLKNTCAQGICAPTSLGGATLSAKGWWALRDQAATVASALMPDGQEAWYWVEVLNAPTQSPPFIYRITVAVGHQQPGAGRLVLQAVWTRTGTARTGQWQSRSILHD